MWRILVLVFLAFSQSFAQFTIPDVTIKAFAPKGLKVTIPDVDGMQLFAFHGKINQPLTNVEPGDLNKDLTQPQKGQWVFYDADVKLKEGDTLYYWYFVQHNRLGYRKEDQVLKIEKLLPPESDACGDTKTTINGGSKVCSGELIFEDNFNKFATVDTGKWLIEEYIPRKSKDYEFVSYRNDPETIFIRDSNLHLKPIAFSSRNDLKGTLILNKCTKTLTPGSENECQQQQVSFLLLPPVKSARVRSKFTFRYGRVEIRAKLPSGDWIYPIMSLFPVEENLRSKIVMAFSRGNNRLTDSGGRDIGGRNLYGGYVPTDEGPERTSQLKTHRLSDPISSGYHKFELRWEPDKVTLSIDGVVFGTGAPNPIRERNFVSDTEFAWEKECYLSLGVAVGGVTEFPDDTKSDNEGKPWGNFGQKMLADFFNARDKWHRTWNGDDAALKVDYVKIWAL